MSDPAVDLDTGGRWVGLRRIRTVAWSIGMGEAAGVLVPIAVLAIMGHISLQAAYVRSIYLPVALLFMAVQVGFDLSNQVCAAVNTGAGRLRDVIPVAASMARVGAAVWGGLSLLVILVAPLLADLLQVPPAEVGTFVAFSRLVCLTNLLFFPTTLCASSLRGSGHARAATAITLTGATLEVGGVAAFGFGTGLGVFALPVAIAVGGTAALTLGLVQLRRHGIWAARGPLTWRPEVIGQLTGTGLPVATSFLLMAVANIGLLWVLAPFGTQVVTGFAAANQLGSLVLVPASAIASATAITMNQLKGAGLTRHSPQVLRSALALSALVYAPVGLVLWLAREPIAALVAGNPAAATQTRVFLGIVGLSYACMGLTVMSLILIEQIGGGLVAVLLNIPYFGSMLIGGGIIARSVDRPQGLYATMAVLNLCGALLTPAVAWVYVRRMSRGRPPTEESTVDTLVPEGVR